MRHEGNSSDEARRKGHEKVSGHYSFRVDGLGGTHEIYETCAKLNATNISTRKYKFSAWVYCTTGANNTWLGLSFHTAKQGHYRYVGDWKKCNELNKWTLVEGEYEVPVSYDGYTVNTIGVVINNENGQGTIYVDNVRLYPFDALIKTSSKTVWKYNGIGDYLHFVSHRNHFRELTRYYYDYLGRIRKVTDFEGNIVKKIEYNTK